jgi:hypothetical protein
VPPLDQLPSLSFSLPVDEPDDAVVALQFTMDQQRASKWCWAAVAASVSKYFLSRHGGVGYQQCQVVNLVEHDMPEIADANCCCNNPAAENCPCKNSEYNVEADLDVALTEIQHFDGPVTIGCAEFDVVSNEIQHGNPVCIRFAYSTGDAHFAVIYDAFRDSNDNATYALYDPLNVDSWTTSATNLLNSYRQIAGSWSNTYFTQ